LWLVSIALSPMLSFLILPRLTFRARLELTVIAGVAIVIEAFPTALPSVIVSLPPLTLALNFNFLPFALLITIPFFSDLEDLAKLRPLGSDTTIDLIAGAKLPAPTVKTSFALRLAIPPSDPCDVGGPGLMTVQLNAVLPPLVNPSPAETVTVYVPAVVGTPEMSPLAALMLSPAGSPDAA